MAEQADFEVVAKDLADAVKYLLVDLGVFPLDSDGLAKGAPIVMGLDRWSSIREAIRAIDRWREKVHRVCSVRYLAEHDEKPGKG